MIRLMKALDGTVRKPPPLGTDTLFLLVETFEHGGSVKEGVSFFVDSIFDRRVLFGQTMPAENYSCAAA